MDAFERAAKDAARQLRKMPKELRKEMGRHVQQRVAVPLAGYVADAARGATPWGVKIAPVVKARLQGDPTIAIGAARKVFSGGASVNQVVYGANWGGGRRRKATARRLGGNPYTRSSTAQFIRGSSEFIYSTFRAKAEWALNEWVQVLDPYLTEWESGGQ